MRSADKPMRLALLLVLLLPLFSMVVIPFYDTSEPRYAEIARVMAQSGDWITPWFSPDTPFWGKPPLSFWMQALFIKAFGANEFAARFPAWLCLLLSDAVLLTGVRALYGKRIALWAIVIYSTCALTYIGSGAVLTDPFLAFGTTLSLVSFAVVAQARDSVSGWWKYGFFMGLVIGLLAKGPLAVVISAVPVFVWYVFNRRTAAITRVLPWIKGLALVAALSLPWYILAEIKTPGFLDYFIVGEHWRRFLDPGWKGDLYGTAHQQPYGMIWPFWLMSSFPWGLVVVGLLLSSIRSTRLRTVFKEVRRYPLFWYWLAGALFTPVFFTLAANILWTYLFPGLAGLSVLVAMVFDRLQAQFVHAKRYLLVLAGVVPTVMLVLSFVAWLKPNLYLRSTEQGLVHYVAEQGEPVSSLHYYRELPFSAQFYSAGQAQLIQQNALEEAVAHHAPWFVAVPKSEQGKVMQMLGGFLEPLYVNKDYILIRLSPLSESD